MDRTPEFFGFLGCDGRRQIGILDFIVPSQLVLKHNTMLAVIIIIIIIIMNIYA
jgi:hypothetical protein